MLEHPQSVVTATDNADTPLSVTDTFDLTVTNTNDAPTLATAQADASTAEDTAYSLDVSGNFADVDVGDRTNIHSNWNAFNNDNVNCWCTIWYSC